MPELTIPEAVIKRREERQENERRRAKLLAAKQKKTAPAYTPRTQAVPLPSNSVAARRLAAKRGEAVSGAPTSVAPTAILSPKSFQSRAFDEPEPDAGSSFGHITSDDFFGNSTGGGGVVSSAAADLFFNDGNELLHESPKSEKTTGMKKLFGEVDLESNSDPFKASDETNRSSIGSRSSFPGGNAFVTNDMFGGKTADLSKFDRFEVTTSLDPFVASSGPSSVKRPSFGAPTAAVADASGSTFDPFDSSARVSFGSSEAPASDPFEATSSSDPFAASSRPSSVKRPSFGAPSEAEPSSSTFDPFDSSARVSFGSSEAPASDPFAASSRPSSVKRPSFGAPTAAVADASAPTFDPFDISTSSSVHPTPTPSFNPFADSPSFLGTEGANKRNNSSTFLDDFTDSTASRPKTTTNSAQLMSLFDQPQAQQSAGMPRRGSGGVVPGGNQFHGGASMRGSSSQSMPQGSRNDYSNPFSQSNTHDPFGSLGVVKKR